MSTDEKRATATEELKLLSSIIGRIESTIYIRQGWLFTLILGLIAVLLKGNPLICLGQFLIVSISITIFFFIIDIFQRLPVHGAIERSSKIEKFLSKNEGNYEGPAISEALGQVTKWDILWKIFKKPRIFVPYLGLALIIVIVGLVFSN